MGADPVRAELADAGAALAAERAAAEAAQLDLLAVPSGRHLTLDEARIEGETRRGRGRPKGAANLATREIRELLALPGNDPIRRLAAWGSMEPEEMARRIGCTTAEAFDRLAKIWSDLAPYRAAKLAPTDDQGRSVPNILVAIGGAVANGEGARAPWMRAIEGVEYQALSAPADAPSKGEPSKGSENP